MYTIDLLVKFRRKKVDLPPIWNPDKNSILAILTAVFSNLSAYMGFSFLRTIPYIETIMYLCVKCVCVCVCRFNFWQECWKHRAVYIHMYILYMKAALCGGVALQHVEKGRKYYSLLTPPFPINCANICTRKWIEDG